MGDAPMNSTRTRTFSSVLIAVASWGANSHAWAQTAPSPSLSPAEGGGATIAAVVVIVGLLMVIGVVVKLFDLKQRRGAGGGRLQAQHSDARCRGGALARLP